MHVIVCVLCICVFVLYSREQADERVSEWMDGRVRTKAWYGRELIEHIIDVCLSIYVYGSHPPSHPRERNSPSLFQSLPPHINQRCRARSVTLISVLDVSSY